MKRCRECQVPAIGVMQSGSIALQLSWFRYRTAIISIEREINRPSSCPHCHLKEVLITGAYGYMIEIDIAVYLLNNAIVQKMVITHYQIYNGSGTCETGEACARWAAMGRQKVYEHLLAEVSPPL
ncbi:hypothetical protein DITRI_Ditri02bG0191000 [Diplodiscus trichospermus]